MDYTKRIIIPDTVFAQEIEGEVVLLDMASENYFGLDAIGSEIWNLLKEGKTLQEAYDVLLEHYEVTPEKLKDDLEAFVSKLLATGLVSFAD
ncbi:MAG: PqqD family protein [Campylobacterales bacterium]